MDEVNRQHMATMGLDPESLGKPVDTPVSAWDTKSDGTRCVATNPETGNRCAMANGHPYDEHIRGKEHWPAVEPTRAPGRREGDQALPTGDLDQVDDQTLLAAELPEQAVDLLERRRLGIQRYGQGHRPFNGRNTIQDAYDEGVDQTVYLGSLLRARAAHREELVHAVQQTFLAESQRHYDSDVMRPDLAELAVDRMLDYVTVKIEEGTHAVP